MEKDLEKFLFTLEVVEGKSPNTVKGYKKDIEQFFEYLRNNEEIENLEDVKILTIRSFMAYLTREKKVSKRSINRKISAIRTFFDYLLSKGIIETNIVDMINLPRYQRKLPTYLTEKEFEKIKEVIDKETIIGIRDMAIVELLFSSGMRASEISNLKPFMINMRDRELKIIGKGNKERLTFFNKNSKYWLEKYIEIKKQKRLDQEFIFLNRNGTQLTTRSIRRNISKYAREANIEKEVSTHTFRHSFATFLINRGVDIIYVQELLGHSSIATTQVYTQISPQTLRDVYLKSHPLAK